MVDNYLTRNYLFDNTTSDRSRVSYSLLHWYVTSFVAIETVLPKESIFHEQRQYLGYLEGTQVDVGLLVALENFT